MTRAYEEMYLDDAMNNLGDMFDYAINDCGYDAEDFYTYFIISGVASAFEKGNPKYIAGLSGLELASIVISRTIKKSPEIAASEYIDKSAEYWAGWILAYYQWYSSRRFADMKKRGLTMECILRLYPTLHEADVSKFVSIADQIVGRADLNSATNLKRIRKAGGMTQKKLAEYTGVSLRMIQLYEQRKQDINMAKAVSLTRIAHVLGCDVEDILEQR